MALIMMYVPPDMMSVIGRIWAVQKTVEEQMALPCGGWLIKRPNSWSSEGAVQEFPLTAVRVPET
jgi:hypothetical protein